MLHCVDSIKNQHLINVRFTDWAEDVPPARFHLLLHALLWLCPLCVHARLFIMFYLHIFSHAVKKTLMHYGKSQRLERGECISASLCWFSSKGGRSKGVHSGISRSSYSEGEVFLKRKKNLEHRKLKPVSNLQMSPTLSTQVCSLTTRQETGWWYFAVRILPDWTLIHKL